MFRLAGRGCGHGAGAASLLRSGARGDADAGDVLTGSFLSADSGWPATCVAGLRSNLRIVQTCAIGGGVLCDFMLHWTVAFVLTDRRSNIAVCCQQQRKGGGGGVGG